MTIVTGKTAPQPSLEDSARMYPVSVSLDFTSIIFLHSNVVTLASNPPTWRITSLYLSPSDKVVRFSHQAPGSLLVAFFDPQGYGGGITTSLHTRILSIYKRKI
jgi:hypothetical protein